MSRRARSRWLAIGVAIVVGSGCSHLVETRSVSRFSGALESGDLASLRDATSPGFRQKALRDGSAIEAMALLEWPAGEVKVAEVNELSDTRRRVKVEVTPSDGGSPETVTYELSRDPESSAWLVDDVLLKQTRRGSTVTRSATELMDLLLCVHEMQEAWGSGDRKRLLDSTTESFSKELEQIPGSYLDVLVARVAVSDGRTFSARPKASLEKGTAQVRYGGPEGDTVLSMLHEAGQWRVDDIVLSARSSRRRPESVRLLAGVVGKAAAFLDAYQAGDREKIKEHASESFYRNGLSSADLASETLPPAGRIDQAAEIRLQQTFSDIVIKQPDGLVRLSLVREPSEDPVADSVDAHARRFQVAEVTLVDFDNRQERRLSSVFTVSARLRLFLNALRQRDLLALRHNSSVDLNQRVWNQLTSASLPDVLGLAFTNAPLDVSGVVFRGAVTEVSVTQGDRAMTFVLREQNGSLRVDDIRVPADNRPGSLKQQFERLIPVQGFARALDNGGGQGVTRHASADFNRLVWSQVPNRMPDQAVHVPRFLRTRLRAIRAMDPEEGEDREVVLFGDRDFGARVVLVLEAGRFRVDDIQLLAGEADGVAPTWLKQALRLMVARPQNRPSNEAAARPAVRESVSPEAVRAPSGGLGVPTPE